MKLTKIFVMTAAILALAGGAAMAQSFACDGGVPLAIPDNGYDGSLGSMACCTITASGFGSGTTITDVNLELQATHTWVGDTTIKVVSPAATVVTVMSRPGLAETTDGTTGECCGDSSDLDGAALTFDDAAASGVSAEDMGNTIAGAEFVCTTDTICNFIPNPGTGGAPGTNLADFNGEDLAGAWQVCISDGAAGDTGNLVDASLTFGAVPVELQSFTIE